MTNLLPSDDDGLESEDGVTHWFRALESGDQRAAERLWKYCVPRMVQYSRSRLPPHLRKALDEEDVAASAFKSLCNGAQNGQLTSVQNRTEMLKLITCITSRKTKNYIKHETRLKRGGGNVRGESIFGSDSASRTGSLDAQQGSIPSPEFFAEHAEQCQRMLDQLDDPVLETIALLRLEGYSVAEIAKRIGCAKRSVERRLGLIRQIWSDEG